MTDSTEIVRLKCLCAWCTDHGSGGGVPLCPTCWALVDARTQTRVILAYEDAIHAGDLSPFQADGGAISAVADAIVQVGVGSGHMTVAEAAARLTLVQQFVKDTEGRGGRRAPAAPDGPTGEDHD